MLASDNDEQAVAVARRHARRNGVGCLVRVECRAGAGRTGCHDLVFANILARPLVRLAPVRTSSASQAEMKTLSLDVRLALRRLLVRQPMPVFS